MQRNQSQIALSPPTHVRVGRVLFSVLQGTTGWVRMQLARRRTRRELQVLDDAALRDIGLRREEIPSIAAEAAGLAASTRRRIGFSERAGW